MVTSKTIRRNKKYVNKVEFNPSIPQRKISNTDKIRKVLSDGKPHTMKVIANVTKIKSYGNLYNIISNMIQEDELTKTKCIHCDSNLNLYTLK